MLLDGRFSAAICALFHVMHSISGRHPSAALMRAGDGGGDGFGLRFIVADGAYLMPGTGFSGSCFFINDPFSEGVGGIINAGCVTVCTDFPMVGFIRCPVGKGGMVTGVKPTVWFAADFALFLCVAGGSAACVGGFFYICFAILAGFPMVSLRCRGLRRRRGLRSLLCLRTLLTFSPVALHLRPVPKKCCPHVCRGRDGWWPFLCSGKRCTCDVLTPLRRRLALYR